MRHPLVTRYWAASSRTGAATGRKTNSCATRARRLNKITVGGYTTPNRASPSHHPPQWPAAGPPWKIRCRAKRLSEASLRAGDPEMLAARSAAGDHQRNQQRPTLRAVARPRAHAPPKCFGYATARNRSSTGCQRPTQRAASRYHSKTKANCRGRFWPPPSTASSPSRPRINRAHHDTLNPCTAHPTLARLAGDSVGVEIHPPVPAGPRSPGPRGKNSETGDQSTNFCGGTGIPGRAMLAERKVQDEIR